LEEGPTNRRWRYWIVYKWTVLGLWLLQLILLAPDMLFERGRYYTYGWSLFENSIVFLTVGIGAAFVSSVVLGSVWAFAIWRLLRIGQGAV